MNKISTHEVVIAPRQHGAMEYTVAPTDLDKVRRYRLERIREQLRQKDYAGILLFNQINTRYATDATNMQVWCAHYETRCVFIATDGPVILFDYGDYPHLAQGLATVDEYRVNKSFYFFTAGSRGPERAELFAEEITDLVAQYGGDNKRLAVDRLSYEGTEPLLRRGLSMHSGEEVMELARVIKSAEELILMQHAIDVCELGMHAMRDALAPGITENALWAKLHETNIALGGEWIETRLLSSGPRTNPWFRESSMRAIQAGEIVSLDTDLIGPYGYCADISRSWLCGDGKPTDEQRRLYSKSVEQIEYNKNLLKPGVAFSEVSQNAWKIPEEFSANRYPSLIHGVGLADEYPSFKHWVSFEERGYDGMIEEGMTLCVESYIGSENGKEGIKLEEQILITADGHKQMSTYPLEEDWL